MNLVRLHKVSVGQAAGMGGVQPMVMVVRLPRYVAFLEELKRQALLFVNESFGEKPLD